jgi:glutaconate CoA-transferase subunit A
MTQMMTLTDAVATISDGARLGIGGVLLERKPIAAVAALARSGRRDLAVSSFLAGLDIELLVAAGSAGTVRTGYVGYEHRGGAPVFRQAEQAGSIQVEAHSELTYTRGLRAAAAGLPFLPLRGAVGTELVADLDLREVDDPYGSGPVLVAPATPLDVAIIQAAEVDRSGAVAVPAVMSFLWDADATLAAAADTVIVTAERVVERIVGPAVLTGLDVDVVVETPGGAAPLGMPGEYGVDEGWLGEYLASDNPEEYLLHWLAEGDGS